MRLAHISCAFTIAVCGAALASCGGTSHVRTELGEHSITPKVSPPSQELVSSVEIAAAPINSPQHVFLTMWSELQWQSYTDALSHYPPGLLRTVGVARMLQALEFEGSLFRTTKPSLHGETYDDGHVSVRYTLAGTRTPSIPSSITWQRENGRWVVYYDPALDAVLRSWAQAEWREIHPTAKSSQAVLAAVHAGELQSHYVAVQRSSNGR